MAPKKEENKSYDYEFALLKKPSRLRRHSFDIYEPFENFYWEGEKPQEKLPMLRDYKVDDLPKFQALLKDKEL